MPRIRTVSNLREYFMQSVSASMKRNDLEVAEHTSYYVVNLLTLYARSEALFDEGASGPELRPVALLLADAVDSTHEDMSLALRRVGDRSLFIAGFLGDGLKRKPVDIDYYVGIGGAAYASLARGGGRSRRDRTLAPVFAELADHFVEFVDVLTELAERRNQDRDVLRLYETWAKTGSRRSARLLRERGIEPDRDLRRKRKPH